MTKTDVQELIINANTKVLMQDFEGAYKDYSKAIKNGERDPILFCNRGIIEKKLGNTDKAEKDFDRAIELNKKYAAAYFYRGEIKLERFDLKDAVNDFDKAISLEPNLKMYIKRGAACQKLGDYEEALENFAEAEKIDGENAELQYYRGITLAAMGEKMAAKEDLQKAAEVGMEDANSYVIKNNLLF